MIEFLLEQILHGFIVTMERLKAGWAALLLCVGFWIGVLVTNLELYPIQIHGDKQRQATWSKTKTIEHSSPLIWNPLNPVSDSSRTASVAMNPRTLRRGKEIRYQPIDENCYKPKYLSGYGKSLCWDMNEGKPGYVILINSQFYFQFSSYLCH